jgi:hypothetical protein
MTLPRNQVPEARCAGLRQWLEAHRRGLPGRISAASTQTGPQRRELISGELFSGVAEAQTVVEVRAGRNRTQDQKWGC